MTKCYYCGKTDGSHDISCICGKAAPPAMNAASPTDAEKFQSIRANFDAAMKDPVQRVLLETVGWLPPSRQGQGSATSGEAAAITPWRERGYEDEHSDVAMMAEIADLRAALAASAEQSNNQGAALDEYGETDFGFTFAGTQLEAGDKRLASLIVRALGTAHPAMDDLTALLFRARSTPVSKRAAAPASVPEGYKLAPAEPTDRMTYIGQSMRYESANSIGAIYRAMISAAPEVAQPAAQGESIDTPEFSALAARYATTKAGKDYMAMVAHVHEWGASQRQEGRRDMHETNIALVNENCALVEKLRAMRAVLERGYKSLASAAMCQTRDGEAAWIAMGESLAAPAPTAGEPNTRTDEACNSALRAQHDESTVQDAFALAWQAALEAAAFYVEGHCANGEHHAETILNMPAPAFTIGINETTRPRGAGYGIIDPDYGRIYTIVRTLAWQEGYAIGLHGSFTRDLDLIAVPWDSGRRCDPEKLVRRIVAATGLTDRADNPGVKAHGRKVWTLLLPEFGDPRFVDLSIFPTPTVEDGCATQGGKEGGNV